MRMRAAIIAFLAVSLWAGGAARCQEQAPAESAPPVEREQKVTLRLVVPAASATVAYQRAQRAVFDAYLRSHPEIDIRADDPLVLQTASGSESSDLLAIAGGISPDVFSLYFQAVHSYIEQGFIMPMDEYLESWEGAKQVPEQLWPVATAKDERGLEHRYGAISDWPTNYLIYRRDLFREVGLDPDRPPANWEALFEAAKRLSIPDVKVETAFASSAGQGRWGLFIPFTGTYNFSNFIWQAGGEIVRKREDGRWEAVFDSPEGVAALEFFKRLRWAKWTRGGKEYTGVVRTGFGEAQQRRESQLFARGEVAMVIMGLHRLQDVQAENVVRMEDIGIAPLPAGPTGIRASIVDGSVLCMSSRLKGDRAKRDAAWEYIRHMTSAEAKAIETKVYVEAGLARFVRNPHWLQQFGYEEYFEEIDPQHLRAYDEALKYGRPEPFAPDYAAMGTEMAIPLSKVARDPEVDCAKEFAATARMINTHFYKLYPEEEMRYKRRVFGGLVAAGAAFICFLGYSLVRSLGASVRRQKSGMAAALRSSGWKHIYAWVFLTPAVLTILLWSYFPLARGSVMALYDYRIFGVSKFVGIDNFIEAFGQPLFWKALRNTLYYSALSMTFGFATPIALALLLSEVPRFKITFRVLFYLPALTSSLVVVFLWKELFFDASPTGLLNRIIAFLHIPPQTWLQDPRIAMVCIIVPGIWAGAGPGSIIYLAALKTVPDEIYEAAEIDGAGTFHKITRVTLSYLKPLILINFIGAFIGTFQATQNILVMTMGGPENATHTLSLEIWRNAFLYLKFGYATAMAWIMGSMLVGFTLYQLRIFQKVQFTAGGSS